MSGQKAFYIDRRIFILSFALRFTADCHSGNFVIIVAMVLTLSINKEIGLFIYQILSVEFGHLKVGDQLYRVSGTRFFTIAAEDTAGEIDAEEFRIPSSVLVFRRLQRYAIDRAGGRAQLASHTSLTHIRISCQHNPPSPPGR